jgi:hypothetical protein
MEGEEQLGSAVTAFDEEEKHTELHQPAAAEVATLSTEWPVAAGARAGT